MYFSKRRPEHIRTHLLYIGCFIITCHIIQHYTWKSGKIKGSYAYVKCLRKIQLLGNTSSCRYIRKTSYQSVFFVSLCFRRAIFDSEIYVDFIVTGNLNNTRHCNVFRRIHSSQFEAVSALESLYMPLHQWRVQNFNNIVTYSDVRKLSCAMWRV